MGLANTATYGGGEKSLIETLAIDGPNFYHNFKA